MEKRLSRVISLLLAIVMLASLMPVSVHAAEAGDTDLTMSVSSVSGMPGDTVQVQIVLKNNPGLASMKFYVDYDEEVLTLTDVKLSTAFGSYITTPTPYKNHQPITLISPLADVTSEGVLATLTFVIAEDAKDNYHADVTISFKQSDVFNTEDKEVPLTVENGCVEVYHGIPGDINNDREVNTKDAILLFRYIAEWDVDVDTDALDVNGDNAINTKDAIALFRYIAEWPGITLHRGKVCAHELTHVMAQANTCDKEGNTEYWLCNLCGRVYKDADCQSLTTLKDTVIPAIGHNYVDGTCKNCGDEIGPDDYLTDALGHHLIYYPAVESTCSLHGYAAHLVCETCNQIYNMSLVAISKEDLTLPLANHDLTYYEEEQPGEYCYDFGNIAHYYCEDCERIYLDAEGTKEIGYEDVLLYNNHGKIWFVEAREGTCGDPGNIACYVCEDCECIFSDANGENRLKLEDVLIYADHLEIVYVEAKQSTCAVAGNYAHYTCTACGSLFSDENGEKEISANAVIMPTVGHKLVDGACTVCDSRESTAGLEFALNEDGNSYTLVGIGDCEAEEIYVGLYNGLSVTAIGSGALRYENSVKSITIGACVTSIGENAFCGTGLTSFTVPSGVTKLEFGLFQNCEDLTALYIHANVTEIDGYAFYNVGQNLNTIEVDPANPVFTSINNTLINKKEGVLVRGNSSGYIPDDGSVTEIGACAFNNVPLARITIPDSIVRIGDEAFAYSGLRGIYISSGVREIGMSVFTGCNLTSVRVDENNPVLYMGTNCIINRETKTLVLGLAGCVIPDDGSVTTIGSYAFMECGGLTSIVIPASVTTIDEFAFSWSGLTSIVIPETVTDIRYGAFSGCQSLESATILADITVLGTWTFGNCISLREVVIPNGVQTIEYAAFYNCYALTEVTLPESVTSIDARAFHNCRKLTKINYYGTAEQFEKLGFTIPNGATVVYEYGTHSFTYFEEISATCTTQGKKAYYYCEKCGCYFADADGKQEIFEKDLMIPAGHSLVYHPGKEATCFELGWASYESCTECEYTTYSKDMYYSHSFSEGECTKCGLWAGISYFAPDVNNVTFAGGANNWSGGVYELTDGNFASTAALTPNSVITITVNGYAPTLVLYANNHHSEFPDAWDDGTDLVYTVEILVDGQWQLLGTYSQRELNDDAVSTLIATEIAINRVAEEIRISTTTCTKWFSYLYEMEWKGTQDPTIGHELVFHEESAEATCDHPGYTMYATCLHCDERFYFHMEPQLAHQMTYNPGDEISCDNAGIREHWYCSSCDKYYLDEEGTKQISLEQLLIPVFGHSLVYYEEEQPGEQCNEFGHIACYVCDECESIFLDAECTIEIAYRDALIYSNNHIDVRFAEAREATCYEPGNIECYVCLGCERIYFDAECTIEIAYKDAIIYSDVHTGMTYVEAEEATSCARPGNIACYYCEDCERVFADAEGKVELSMKDVLIYSDAHSIVYVAAKEATCSSVGNVEHYVCYVCESYFLDANGEKRTTLDQVTIPTTDHIMVDGACSMCGLHESTAGLAFELNPDGMSYTLIGIGSCTESEIYVGLYNGLPVTAVGFNAFMDNGMITAITLDSCVTCIEVQAFCGCYNLSNIQMTDNVTYIGSNAFCRNPITSFTVPAGVTHLYDWTFQNCDSLEEIIIHKNVTVIDAGTFRGCDNLERIIVAEENPVYVSINNTLISKDAKVLVRGNKYGFIPDDGSVTTIGANAFQGCDALTNLVIPDTIVSIEYDAFIGCRNLTYVYIPASVTYMDGSAFMDCPIAAMEISLDNPVFYVGENCIINKQTKTLIKGFAGCVIPDDGSVTAIGPSAFTDCRDLTEIVIPNTIIEIGSSAFSYTGLTSVVIPNSVTYIGGSAFHGCYSLRSVKLSDNVTELCGWTFGDCESLTTVILPANLERILYNAFYGCYALTEITLPAMVEHVDSMAFEWCENLRIINYCGTKEQFTASNIMIPDGVKVVYNYGNHKGVYHPAVAPTCTTDGSAEYYYCENCGHYFSDTECKNEVFAKDVLIPAKGHSFDDNGVCTVCGAEALVTSEGLEFRLNEDGKSYTWIGLGSCTDTVVVVDTFNGLPVTTVAMNALWDNRSVTEVILGESVTTIEDCAFECAYALTTITMSDNVTYIGQNAFSNTALTSFVIPAGITRLDQWGIFRNCRSLKEITLHAGVSYINGGIFSGCGILDTITVAKGNPYYSMVNGCLVSTKGELVRATKGATIPTDGSVTMIRSYAFAGMDQLEIQIPNSVTHIDINAFCDCHIVSIFIPASVSYIDSYAFQSATIESIAVDEKNPTYAYISGCFINRNTQTLVLGIGNCTIPADGSVTSIGQAAFAHNQSLTSLVIPDTITSIGSDAFQNCQSLQSIVLPSGLTRIEGWTFNNCRQLTSIVIPEGVTYIGRDAFQRCESLKALIVPGAVLTIESGAFYGCSGLTSVIISEGVTTIRDQAFGFCSNLETVTLPVSLTFVDASAFQNCYNLTTIRYAGMIEEFAALGLYLPEGVQIVCGYGDHEIIYVDAKDVTCSEDGNIACYTCIKCGDYFSDAEGKNMILKDQVILKSTGHNLVGGTCTSCGKSEFESTAGLEFRLNDDGQSYTLINGRNCTASNVIIDLYNGLPVTMIDGWAFQGNWNVETVILGSHVVCVYNGAFSDCRNLRSIELNNVTELGTSVFSNCVSLESVVIPEGVQALWGSVFRNCTSLKSVTIPASLYEIAAMAFYGCGNIETIYVAEDSPYYAVIGNSLVRKSDSALIRSTKFTAIPDDGSVLCIDSYAFSGSNALTSLVIPEGVTTIWDYAFSGCPKLTSIYLPSTLQDFSGSSFADSNITNITVAEDHPYLVCKDGDLINVETKTLLVSFSGTIPTDGSVTTIGSYAFSGNGKLSSLVIPDCITSIENEAFQNCYNLCSVVIPNTVTYIGAYAFAQCNNLQSATLPEGLTVIEPGLFEGCNSLQSIVIPNTVTRIGNYAFNNCNALREVTIPNGVTYLGEGAFAWCNSLQKIVIPGTVVETGWNVLRECNNLQTVQFLGSEENFAPLYDRIISGLNVTVIYGCEVHTLTYLEAKDASCYEKGNVACYTCTVCSKYFEDAKGSIELSASNVVLPYSHNLIEVAAKEATCATPGIMAHLYCENCQKRFSPNGDKLYIDVYNAMYDGWSERTLKWTGINGAVFAYDSEAQTYVTTFNGNALFFAASKDVNLELMNVQYNGIGRGWFVATFYDANLNPVDVNELKEGTAYKFGTYNANYGNTYYVTGAVTDVRLLTTLNASKAADVYVQFVDGGICIYMVDPTGLVEVSYEELTTPSGAHTMVDGSCSVCGGVESTAGLEFRLNADGMSYTLVNGSNCTEENIVIDIYNGLPVTAIGDDALSWNHSIRTITLGASVRQIGWGGFRHCQNLTNVTFSYGLETISYYVFQGCTNLVSVQFPDSLTRIEEHAFERCISITEISIPYSVNYIGIGAFSSCSLTSITVDGKNKTFYAENNCLIRYGDQTLIRGCDNSVIPNGIHVIGAEAFRGCSDLTSVVIPNSVVTIDTQAFFGCYNLKNVVLPSGLQTIGFEAFGETGLTSIDLPSGLTYIGTNAFYGCNLTSITMDGKGVNYYVENNCLIEKGSGLLLFGCANSVIPNTVTAIGDHAFAGYYALLSIVIPEGVTSIGNEAFYGCENLVSVELPSTLTEIGSGAFSQCRSLKTINLPEGLTEIKGWTFLSCNSLSDITIPSTVTVIGEGAFQHCRSFINVVIPSGVTSIDPQAFAYGYEKKILTLPASVTFIAENAFVETPVEIYFLGTADEFAPLCGSFSADTIVHYPCLAHNLIAIDACDATCDKPGYVACYRCTECSKYFADEEATVELSVAEVVIPATGHTVVDGACSACGCAESTAGLEFRLNADGMSYTLENGRNCAEENIVIGLYNGLPVTVIEASAFEGNQTVKTVTIAACVKTISEWAFAHCSNLTDVTLTEGLKTIGGYAFYCTGLTEISLPNSVEIIGEAAFMDCRNLSALHIPENVMYIGEGVISYTGVTTVSVASGNKYYYVWNNSLIGRQDQILLWGNADSLIPDGVTVIGSWAFYYCEDLVEVILPDSVTHINHMAFAGCRNLELVEMSNHVEVIGYAAFGGCEKLQSILLPAEFLTTIESYAFEYCRSLTEISIPASVSTIGYEVFKGCSGVQTITVDPANQYYYTSGNCLIAYDTQALLFGCSTSVIPEGVTVIANSAFAGQEGITSIVIPEGVTAIGEEAFSACTNLVSVTLPSTMRELHANAFVNCHKLEEINLPEGLTMIGEQAFASCNSLASMTIPSTVTELGTYAFGWCNSLTSVVIAEGVTKIPEGTFYGCENLESVTIPSTVQTIGYMAFSWCNSLTEIVIPEGVTKLDKQAFSCCQNLKSVTLPSSLVAILDSAFMNCPNLTDVYYLGTAEQFTAISSQIPSGATVHYGPKPETPETHEMVQVAAIAATCTTVGSRAYWLCMDCNKCFSDAEGTTELSANEIMIPALGHSMVNGVCQYCGSDAWDGSIATSFAGGSGTAEDPYLIENGAQLAYLAHAINTDPNNTLYDKCYKLTKSIDLGGRAFTPIAVHHYEGKTHDSLTFQGTFDGNGYAIKNFTTSSYGGCYFGLFGYISNANIYDLDVVNYSLSGELTASVSAPGYTQFCVGAVAGYALHSSIDRCYVSCSIDVSGSSAAVGGIVGYSYSTISNCYVDANINSNMNKQSYVGGVCGEMGSASRADSCFVLAALASFSQKSEGHAGGISGYMYALSDPAAFVNCVVNGTWQGGSNGGYYSGASTIYGFGEGYSTGSGNNYSLSSTGGLSLVCTTEQLSDSTFYTDTLGWSATIWDLDTLDFANGIYPVLMNN